MLEAKQGSTSDAPGSVPRRDTRAYDRCMEAAFVQAVNYARNQAPEAAQDAALPMIEEENLRPVDDESVAHSEPQPWPKGFKEQLAALRAVLLASPRLWALEEVAQAFKSKGGTRDRIAAHLDLLTDLGMLSRVDTPEGPRWHRSQALGA